MLTAHTQVEMWGHDYIPHVSLPSTKCWAWQYEVSL